MQIKAKEHDKILSLLLDVAECSFIRLTQLYKNGRARYQLGEPSHALPLDDDTHQQATSFIDQEIISYGGYQFTFSLMSGQHVHIECTNIAGRATDNNNRKSLASIIPNTACANISLIYQKHIPTFIQSLSDDIKAYSLEHNDLIQSCAQPTHQEHIKQGWRGTLLLKTLCMAIENIQLVDDYLQLTSDKVTKLRSRSALQRGIDQQINHTGMALCMIHCTDFQHVNRKFGQAKGDMVLHEIANVIEQYTRVDDISGRFGGALFGIAIIANAANDGLTLAAKLQTALHKKAYLQNAIRLNFNVGVAFVSQQEALLENGSISSLLINRAEQALKAAQSAAKPSIVEWAPDKFRLDEQEFNYLGGIFTPDNVTNYRNMLLLWDISSIIADEHTFERLLKSVIERLAFTFEFAYAGIVSAGPEKRANPTAKNYSFELTDVTDINDIEWASHPYQDLLENAATLAIENSQHTESEQDDLNSLVIPLGNDTHECFYIMGHKELLNLSHDTVMLFVGFARQLGKAFKRSQLEDQLNKNLAQQNAKLSQELLELKAGMQSSALVYRSAKMQKIVEQTQRAAQTETTVLITGESGTGKEKLINAIHALSPRNKQPLVIVDCGSIPENLIESELFGYIKGAFTGAQNSSIGKIQSAEGGILVLDEIGELPLSMQPKLLRFVQEKHFTPVGGNKSIRVDVKIVAVTNRDLAYEVSIGKFRKDLFYRLNVVTLHNPPLRERIEDIELLCQHFLSKFARQFEMDKKHLSSDTIEQMKHYSWPGNIRELENKLMQASLLTISDEIRFSDLKVNMMTANQIAPQGNATFTEQSRHLIWQVEPNKDVSTIRNFPVTPDYNERPSGQHLEQPQKNGPLTQIQWCFEFAQSVKRLIEQVDPQTLLSVSIGDAIELSLLHLAHKQCRSHSRTAVLLQLPISTARRRLQKDVPPLNALESDANWHTIAKLLAHIVNTEVYIHKPVDTIKNIIATSIFRLHSSNMALASQLMGVSEPTMYKLRKQLQAN